MLLDITGNFRVRLIFGNLLNSRKLNSDEIYLAYTDSDVRHSADDTELQISLLSYCRSSCLRIKIIEKSILKRLKESSWSTVQQPNTLSNINFEMLKIVKFKLRENQALYSTWRSIHYYTSMSCQCPYMH